MAPDVHCLFFIIDQLTQEGMPGQTFVIISRISKNINQLIDQQ